PTAKAEQRAALANFHRLKELSKSDDDDDDDDDTPHFGMGFTNIEEQHRHMRNIIRRDAKREALCQCNPFEYDTLGAFKEIPFDKTLLCKNLQRLSKLTKNDGNLALHSLFVYSSLAEDLESFTPCQDELLSGIIPKDLLHDQSFKRFLFNNTDSTLSTIAVLDSLADKRQIVVVVPHYKNKPAVFHSRLSVEYTEQERKYLSEYTLEKNIIKTLSDRICEFEKSQTPFGPAMFYSFKLLLNANEFNNAKEKDRLEISDYETEQSIIKTLPCWHVAGSTVTTLSRDHLPLISWSGPCYDFILDYQGQKVNYVIRTK
ncbi:MAG: hypothetical protein J6T46_11945, partial [Victivallales bacterium]|nr:hypothetical protein [Victivallales bacterium]